MTESEIHRGMPEEYASRLREARASDSMVGERRVVTILFCDVTGSVAMAGELDPEDWAEVMDDAFECLIPPIYRYEGTVARLMGDGVLAFFGAPIAHEDDPQRAVNAGLEMLKEIEEFSGQLKEQSDLDFDVRIGINTGTVVVGPIGSDLAMEYTAMGDAVNLASRMEQTADPGTVQLAENTYKLVAPIFDVEPLGAIEVKGKREAVPAYRVVGRKTEPGRTRGIEGLKSPLIGREDEFEKLKSVLEDFKNARGGIVTIIGEAGLGKSRLIEELKAEFEANLDPGTPSPWDEIRGIPYDASLPYGLFVQQLRQTCGVTVDDSPEVLHEKVAAALKDAPSEIRDRSIRAIEILLTLARQSEEPEDGSRLEGEALKRELFQAMLSLWGGLVISFGCSLLVLDDLQWADEASVELLLHLFQLTDEMPILLICAMRPYRDSPAWQIKAVAETEYPHRYTEIVLRPFASGEEQSLARNLLDLPDLPKDMGDLILRKSEGNPFFVEELVRTFIDQGVVTRDEDGQAWQVAQEVGTIPIPDNLQAVIVARMDRLEKEVQQTLQLASVIGRSFYHRVLQRISEFEAVLDRHLNTLQRVEIIREATRVPELEYIFRHELTRDAAYQMILKKRRREFHGKVGQALEELFPERRDELAPVLAHHFSQAGDAERALKHYTVAGDTAARLFANSEAISHYSRAIELAKRDSVTGDKLIHLFTSRGRAMELSAAYEDALANYDELEALASERDDRPMELASLLARATLRVTINPAFDPEKGQALCDKALELARALHDHESEAKTFWNLLLLYHWTGRPNEAIEFGEKALAIAREHHFRELLAFILHDLSVVYMIFQERAKDTQRVLDEVNALWKKLSNTPMLADNLIRYTLVDLLQGDFAQALAHGKEAYDLSLSIDNLYGRSLSKLGIGNALVEKGRLDEALPALEESVELSVQAGNPFNLNARASMALAYADMGANKQATDIAKEAHAVAQDQFPQQIPLTLAVISLIYLRSGRHAEATAALAEVDHFRDLRFRFSFPPPMYIRVGLAQIELAMVDQDYQVAAQLGDELLELLETSGFPAYLADALNIKGRVLVALGEAERARAVLSEARTAAEAVGSRRALWQILVNLAEVEADLGNEAEAAKVREAAKEVIEFIAEHAGTEDLRESFLNRHAVKSLMDA